MFEVYMICLCKQQCDNITAKAIKRMNKHQLMLFSALQTVKYFENQQLCLKTTLLVSWFYHLPTS